MLAISGSEAGAVRHVTANPPSTAQDVPRISHPVSDWPTQAPEITFAQAEAPATARQAGETAGSARIHALLAQDVYRDTPAPPPGYSVAGEADLAALELAPADLQRGEFRARVYVTHTDGETRYVVAFRGTQSAEGWVSNVRQGVGTDSVHYSDALRIADRIAASGLADRVSFTGHSLGGGLASTAAIATGAPAHTFNAAGLHGNTIDAANAIRSGYAIETAGDVQAWYVRGEALSQFQDGGDRIAGFILGGIPGAILADAPEAYGDRHALDARPPEGKGILDRHDPVDRHGMDWVINSLPR